MIGDVSVRGTVKTSSANETEEKRNSTIMTRAVQILFFIFDLFSME
jgi:hypothetical protein